MNNKYTHPIIIRVMMDIILIRSICEHTRNAASVKGNVLFKTGLATKIIFWENAIDRRLLIGFKSRSIRGMSCRANEPAEKQSMQLWMGGKRI